MSERGIALSEVVAQLFADARRLEGLSAEELADRAGVDPAYMGLVERRSRQPTLAVAANLAEALGLSLSQLIAVAEQDVKDGSTPEIDLVPVAPKRSAAPANLRETSVLNATTGLTGETITQSLDFAYRRLDLVDEQIRGPGSRPLVALLAPSDFSSLLANLLSVGIARASNDSYVQSGPDHSASLLPLQQGLPELDVATARATSLPATDAPKAGVYLAFRYVLGERDGTFLRGNDERGDTAAVWEVRFGELREDDFRAVGSSARLKKAALDGMELVYYEWELLPYARATGAYARAH